ncbi:MAG: TRAP transporter small permease [Kiritimatiellae bacterium]|nr:TRAP transporter small permease [Kiritimatiellia bacterium]
MSKPLHLSPHPATHAFWSWVVVLVKAMTLVSCAGLAALILITCGDIVLRVLKIPVKGAYDLIRICGALTIACAVPLTTAMKGHVAIEYFFHKLNRRGRVVVDSLMRLIMLVSLLFAAWAAVGCGLQFFKNSEVTDTIAIPLFWLPWVIALAFVVTALVVLFHLLYPGRELIKS